MKMWDMLGRLIQLIKGREWSVRIAKIPFGSKKKTLKVNPPNLSLPEYKFSESSKLRLSTCHRDLQILFYEVIKERDCSIICGWRDKESQDNAYKQGFSHLKYPRSKHNKIPSLAVDVLPYPSLYSDEGKIREFASYVFEVAQRLKLPVKWGGHWATLLDLPHWEL